LKPNLIVYLMREGYEIKTWIYADEKEPEQVIEERAYAKFKEVGVEVLPNDSLDWQWF
jgi:hypothetical protein